MAVTVVQKIKEDQSLADELSDCIDQIFLSLKERGLDHGPISASYGNFLQHFDQLIQDLEETPESLKKSGYFD